jgi:hypothetical protein
MAANAVDVACRVELSGVVRMDSCGVIDEARMIRSDGGRTIRGGDGFADGDNSDRASITRARDHCVAVVVERRIGEVGVAIDKAHTNKHRRDCAAVSS